MFCFGYPTDGCEAFDGEETALIESTEYKHYQGCLAHYKGQPTAVGSLKSVMQFSANQKVETLTPTGWEELADHPE